MLTKMFAFFLESFRSLETLLGRKDLNHRRKVFNVGRKGLDTGRND